LADLNAPAEAKTCEALEGLIAEGQEAIDADGEPSIKDAALIAAAQRVEHYEIAAYSKRWIGGGCRVRRRLRYRKAMARFQRNHPRQNPPMASPTMSRL
jgi:hypothetical protein